MVYLGALLQEWLICPLSRHMPFQGVQLLNLNLPVGISSDSSGSEILVLPMVHLHVLIAVLAVSGSLCPGFRTISASAPASLGLRPYYLNRNIVLLCEF